MKESVAIVKEANKKQRSSPTRSDNSIQRLRNEPERQLGSLRDVIGNIRRNGDAPSVESISTELSVMPSSNRASALLALQQTHGNRYVQRVVTGIQAKLKVGQPGDIYEQEADRVAEQVMQMPEPQVQRQPEEEEEEKKEELIETKPLSDQITPLVQRQVEEEEEEDLQTKEVLCKTPEVTADFETRIHALKGRGQPLPKSARNFFEPRFGNDFSRVRVHSDAQATETAQALKARAFTMGRDVVFGTGQYAPGTKEGQRLLAHELTHVVQQQSIEGTIRRFPADEDECLGYQPGEISTSRTASGHLDPDVTLHAPGRLLIADFGVGRQSVKPSTQTEPLLRSWLSTFESDNSYRLSIAGYSDCVGSDSANTRIRHGRAEQVERLLGSGAHSRVTFRGMAGLGDYVTNNNTIENRARNRGVIIEFRQEITFPPITIPGTPGCVVAVPGSSTPTSIGSRGACGSGADFRFFDFPTLRTADRIKVYAFSNAPLEGIFRTELGVLAGAEGNRMITHFMTGTGGTLRHGLGSTISTLATSSRTMASATGSVQKDIGSQLTGQAAGGTVDYRLLHLRLPTISFGFRDGTTLKGAIGGTQGLDLFIKDFNVPHCTRNYTATIRFEICDDFGVDTSDLYSPGLISFWVLQHQRRGHRPFINEIIVEKPISGSF